VKLATRPATLLAAAIGLSLAAAPASAQERARVAVLGFDNLSGWWGQDLGNAASERLTTELVNANQFTVIEREMIGRILDEQGFQMTGAVDADQVVEIGRIAGVDYIIVGSITQFSIQQTGGRVNVLGRSVGGSRTQAESALDVRAISTRTAAIVAAARGEGDHTLTSVSIGNEGISQSSPYNPGLAQEALTPAIEQIVSTLRENAGAFEVPDEPLPPAAPPTVVGISSDGQFYIDQGQNFGIQVGNRYAVMRVVDEIVDASGNVLDVVTERVGVLEVVRVLSQSAIAAAVEGEAAEGDVLEALEGG
jgi:curli biogenesis system outer membrane secretion channel CsgG